MWKNKYVNDTVYQVMKLADASFISSLALIDLFYFFFLTLSSSSQVKDVWHEEKVYIYLLFFLKIYMLNVKNWVLKKTISLISEIEVQNKDR